MINRLLKFSLGNKFAVFLMVVLVILGGVYSSVKMRLELLPDVEEPMISVNTVLPGATPQTVQEDISDKIDNQIRGMAHVENVKSQSLENVSMVQVSYEDGTDMDKAEEALKKEIDKLKLTEDAREPELMRNSMNAFPVVVYSFSDKNGNLEKATKAIEKQLIPKLETVDGVQNVQMNGQTARQATIKFKQSELQKRGMSAKGVEDYIKNASGKTPLGLFQFGKKEKSIVVNGEFTSADALKNFVIPVSAAQGEQGQPGSDESSMMSQGSQGPQSNDMVRLSDIADVKIGQERESISRTNGKDAIDVQIVKAQDANTVQVKKDTDAKIKAFVKDNKDLTQTKIMDTAKPIQDSIYTMLEKAILGTIVAIIVILLFLRNIRTTAISVVSIPMSLLIAMIALKLSDVSLNILTLGALTVAIGRVIDDSIVVIENIYRRMSDPKERESGDNLVISATAEVFKPIMSSTLVTIVVFLPLVFVAGSVGEMFRPFALAITFSLLASLLVSITIVPALASTFFKNGIKQKRQRSLGAVGRGYKKVLNWSLNHKWIVLIITTVILIGSIGLGAAKIGTSFISTGEDKFMALTYTPKPGETKEQVLKNAEQVQKYLNSKDKVKKVQYSLGGASPIDPTGSTNNMAVMIEYASDTKNFDTKPDRVLKHIAGFKQEGEWKYLDMGTGGGNNEIEVKVSGPSGHEIKDTVKAIEDKMKQTSGVVNVKSDLTEVYDQYTIDVDKNKATEKGLSAGQLAMGLNQNIPETTLTTINEKGHKVDVKVEKEKQTNWTKEKLNNLEIPTPTGEMVQLKDIATLKSTQTPSKLIKEDGDYTTTVTGKISGKDVGGISTKVMDKVNKVDKPANVKINSGGATDDINRAMTQLSLAMIAAVVIVYLVLVLTFKGGLAPFTILFSLPYIVIGVVLALVFTGETLSVPSMIGVLMLIGIVVTNAIVLIDRVINNEHKGMEMKEALLEAGGTRIRPILMTALATIGALVPMLFGQDSSILISKGLAATVIGGLVSSTILTLIVVPVIYEILFTLKDKVTHMFSSKRKKEN
ncbi:efflux RND transporter permease subunit [Staphylococcus simulans]|uniref:efflux RND transporter permease subunit n=1 Tax=Staphylococcus simulans TaxID=1286 RepID=UPI0027EC7C93|nr:efflux RND transporter permease subunit [Staphylococcus simulans]MDQ7116188.1 efflux RND transporter permease subunit [Staphylococcus simulans]MDQ7139597.1 efflux RND transporter permease subunit [Staphylococcus simulans]WML97404.1 efflux RND transporter permease subunit [Staphylococcus simulans]WML99076.1 efflux RND transporter permease subunit [Staphylococcus simulans]WMM04599.1 efflux RND transporter permease subunit [Staphylococcus simulans]